MRYGHIFLFSSLCCALNLTAMAQGPDLATSLKRFSDFPKIDVKRLLGGDILAERGAATNFPNGISAQFCFAVPASPEETARRLQGGDVSGPEGPNVYAHCVLHPPSTPIDFSKLYLDPKQGPTKWLLEKTIGVDNGKSELNLSRTDATELAACVKKNPDSKGVSACWAGILSARTAAFQHKGFDGVSPYDSVETTQYNQIDQLRSMLREHGKIVDELSPVLSGAGLIHGIHDVPQLAPSQYWSLFNANHHAVVNLGAIYRLAIDNHYQVLDVEYYVSDRYYSAATLYEIWPIHYAGGTGSLVWRGDFYVAPMLNYMKGIERIAYGAIMIHEIKREIQTFKNCFGAKPDIRSSESDLPL